MSKNKLSKFADLETFSCVLQYPYARLEAEGFPHRGVWRTGYFQKPDAPLIIELGCGRGEYTVALASLHSENVYIGIDRKGARIWAGAGVAHRDQMPNVAFVRTDINLLDRFFAPGRYPRFGSHSLIRKCLKLGPASFHLTHLGYIIGYSLPKGLFTSKPIAPSSISTLQIF